MVDKVLTPVVNNSLGGLELSCPTHRVKFDGVKKQNLHDGDEGCNEVQSDAHKVSKQAVTQDGTAALQGQGNPEGNGIDQDKHKSSDVEQAESKVLGCRIDALDRRDKAREPEGASANSTTTIATPPATPEAPALVEECWC